MGVNTLAKNIVVNSKLHMLEYTFGWIIVILMALSIFNFSGGRFSLNLNTTFIAVLMLGILSIVSGKRR